MELVYAILVTIQGEINYMLKHLKDLFKGKTKQRTETPYQLLAKPMTSNKEHTFSIKKKDIISTFTEEELESCINEAIAKGDTNTLYFIKTSTGKEIPSIASEKY